MLAGLRPLGLAALILAGAVLMGGRMQLFSGTTPSELGAIHGRLKPVPETPNAVSSQAADAAHFVAPLRYGDNGPAAIARLARIVAAQRGARVVELRDDYLRAEFSSEFLGFVDDVEFLVSAAENLIHVRSASRLGYSDFGVNRARVDMLRSRFEAGT